MSLAPTRLGFERAVRRLSEPARKGHGSALPFHRKNQWSFTSPRNSTVIGKPIFDPITESLPHFGQIAVWPTPRLSEAVHSSIAAGGKMAKQ